MFHFPFFLSFSMFHLSKLFIYPILTSCIYHIIQFYFHFNFVQILDSVHPGLT